MTSSNLNYILKALSPITIALVVRASTYEYEGGQIQFSHWQAEHELDRCVQRFCRSHYLTVCTLYFISQIVALRSLVKSL